MSVCMQVCVCASIYVRICECVYIFVCVFLNCMRYLAFNLSYYSNTNSTPKVILNKNDIYIYYTINTDTSCFNTYIAELQIKAVVLCIFEKITLS